VERDEGADLGAPPPHQVGQRHREEHREYEVFVCRIGSGSTSPACSALGAPAPLRWDTPTAGGGAILRRTSMPNCTRARAPESNLQDVGMARPREGAGVSRAWRRCTAGSGLLKSQRH
jgi:hypothetical protein